jgi:hypothetical protein
MPAVGERGWSKGRSNAKLEWPPNRAVTERPMDDATAAPDVTSDALCDKRPEGDDGRSKRASRCIQSLENRRRLAPSRPFVLWGGHPAWGFAV